MKEKKDLLKKTNYLYGIPQQREPLVQFSETASPLIVEVVLDEPLVVVCDFSSVVENGAAHHALLILPLSLV